VRQRTSEYKYPGTLVRPAWTVLTTRVSRRRSSDSALAGGSPAPLASLLVTLATALYLLLLLVAWHRRGGMTEREEWLVYIEGWALIPLLSVAATALVHHAVGRRGGVPAEHLWIVAFTSVGVLVLGAVGLRGASASPSLLGVVEVAVAAAYLPALLVGCRVPVPIGRAGAQLVPIGTMCLWAVLTAVLTLPDRPEAPSAVGVLLVALVAVIVSRTRSSTGGRWVHVTDALVLVALPIVLFDPRLPLDIHHHNWFLGPVNAVMHGRTILVDAFTPYGVLSIEFLAAVFGLHLLPMSYVGLALLMTLLVVVQFVGIYVVLRFACRSLAVAVTGMLLAFVVNVAPTDLTKYPSAGPLRFGLPWVLPLLVVVRARMPAAGLATYLAEGVVVGVAAIWDVQTLLATLATWGGVLLAEGAFGIRDSMAWFRLLLGRVAWASLAVVCAHALVVAFVLHASGKWPQWGTFLELVRSFSPEGEGWSLFLAPAWGGWVALVVIYMASIFAAIHALPLVRARIDAARVTIAFAVTLMGVAQLSYYVGLSLFVRLYYVALPAVVVGAFWADRLLGRTGAASTEVSRTSGVCLLIGALLWAGHFESLTRTRLGASIVAAVAAGRELPAPEGCPSLAACLRHRYPVQPATRDALALIERHAPGAVRLGVFLSTRATTETLVLSDRTHVFPLMDASHDGLSTITMARIAAAPHGLHVGDSVFVDRARMAAASTPSSRVQNGDPFLRRLLDRVCREFQCVPGERRGTVTVLRLAPDR